MVMNQKQFINMSVPGTKSWEDVFGQEWLETNGIGGFASSTVSGAHSRRYHGLLVAALNPPVNRVVLLSKLEEALVVKDDTFLLSANQYPGAVFPQGYIHLTEFSRGLFPVFHYEAGGVKLKKTVAAIHGENTVVVLYEVLEAEEKFMIELTPFSSCRDFHHTTHANDSIFTGYLFEHDVFRTKNYHDSPELFIAVPHSSFEADPKWYYNYEFPEEKSRGLDYREDLFAHGKFKVPLKRGTKLAVVISDTDPTGRDGLRLIHNEEKRRERLIHSFVDQPVQQRLALAADQFIVKRGDHLLSVIAGYPWFSDWGRDAMIALPGLCLVTGRFDEARKILTGFSGYVSEGMIPNRFPDHGEAPEYNTVDGALWFFYAVYKYYQYTNDVSFIRKMLPTLQEIIDCYEKGTRYSIQIDQEDGLLFAGEPGVQLTWMDAKIGDWVVTPRIGKAVEINALWYNALCMYHQLLNETGKANAARFLQLRIDRVQQSFLEKFWNQEGGYLYDVLETHSVRSEIRPNQLYALSLPFPLLAGEQAVRVLDIVTSKLLTPYGLRSLSQDDPQYKSVYGGDPWYRDSAYHQGTVWAYLIGPYVDALIRVKGEVGKQEATQLITNFLVHLDHEGIGSLSEIFDGDEPHYPRGCFAQAWSVGEVLRVTVEHKLAVH